VLKGILSQPIIKHYDLRICIPPTDNASMTVVILLLKNYW